MQPFEKTLLFVDNILDEKFERKIHLYIDNQTKFINLANEEYVIKLIEDLKFILDTYNPIEVVKYIKNNIHSYKKEVQNIADIIIKHNSDNGIAGNVVIRNDRLYNGNIAYNNLFLIYYMKNNILTIYKDLANLYTRNKSLITFVEKYKKYIIDRIDNGNNNLIQNFDTIHSN